MQWPERFIYVCNATQASIVNILPLVHAGIERVAEVFIFCGAPNIEHLDDRLKREAIDPALRLVKSIEELASKQSNPPKVHIRFGDDSKFFDWANQMGLICFDARQISLPVLYNLTGGRKPMSIGGIIGGKSQPLLLNVAGSPLRVEFLLEERQIEAKRHAEVSLDSYLAAYNLIETDEDGRSRSEKYYVGNAAIIDAFATRLLSHEIPLISIMMNVTRDLIDAKGKLAGPKEYIFDTLNLADHVRAAFEEAVSELAKLKGLQLTLDENGKTIGFTISNYNVARLIRGGWLEAAIFNRLKRIARARNDVSVFANVKLAFKSVSTRLTAAEIDVALMIGSQLHLVEAKTAGFVGKEAKKGNERSLAQTESIKRLLLGQFGTSIVVNPRESEKELDQQGNFTRRAREGGIHLLLGPSALDDLEKEFQALLELR